MRSVLTAAVAVSLSVIISGCAGSDDDAEASRAISTSIVKQERSGPGALLSLQRKQASCIGDGLVKDIGVDRLRKSGMLTDDNQVKGSVTDAKLSEADARKATDVLFGCADVEAMVERGLARSGNIAREMQPCVNKVIDKASLRSMFTDFFQGDQNAPQALAGPMMRCVAGKAG